MDETIYTGEKDENNTVKAFCLEDPDPVIRFAEHTRFAEFYLPDAVAAAKAILERFEPGALRGEQPKQADLLDVDRLSVENTSLRSALADEARKMKALQDGFDTSYELAAEASYRAQVAEKKLAKIVSIVREDVLDEAIAMLKESK